MKASKYNSFYPFKMKSGEYIAHNSFTNALAIMSKEDYMEFKRYQSDATYKLEESLVQSLQKGGFLIGDDVDEMELLRHRLRLDTYSNDGLGLTIAPTLDCNFCCSYCYEQGCEQHGMMSEKTQNSIVDMVKTLAPHLSTLQVSWYGGEPLLALNIIERLTKQFLDLTKEFGIEYNAGIVTNGYLFTPDNVARLLACKVSYCQITIDGNADVHDSRRPHKSGAGTYKTIIDNLLATSKMFPHISLRVNIDQDNKDAITNVKQALEARGIENVAPYPAPICDNNGCYSSDRCLSIKDFSQFECDVLLSKGDSESIFKKYPQSHSAVCCATAMNSYVISADGALYKCWSDIGRKEFSFGNINSGITNIMNQILYIKQDPTRDPKCRKFKFLPSCLGGCPYKRRTGNSNTCMYFTSLNKRYLKKIAEIIDDKQIGQRCDDANEANSISYTAGR